MISDIDDIFQQLKFIYEIIKISLKNIFKINEKLKIKYKIKCYIE